MKNCENCKQEHNGSYGSGRFCSTKCARGFSTKAKRKEINEKVSKTLSSPPLIKKCKHCGCNFNATKKGKLFCSKSCSAKSRWKDKDYRKTISNHSKKRAIKRHLEGDPSFGWMKRSNLIPSYPETFFMGLLEDNKIKYRREYKMGRYFIDFAIMEKKIALEIDGAHHQIKEVKEKDKRKDKFLNELGWTVIRIPWKGVQEANSQFNSFLIEAGLV